MFDFGIWTSWFNNLLIGCMPEWAATLIECVIIAVLVLLTYTVLALFYILYERKLCAWFQCRLGPMRVGKWGPPGLCRYVQDSYQRTYLSEGHRQIPLQACSLSGYHLFGDYAGLSSLGQRSTDHRL